MWDYKLRALLLGSIIGLMQQHGAAQVSVTTYHNDNGRTGQNVQESILTPAKVNSTTFGRLAKLNIQPSNGNHAYVYAEPLFAPNISIGGTLHNVVYVATEAGQIFAFDADLKQSTPLWSRQYDTPFVPGTHPANYIADTIGIQSTPVIDSATGTMYFVSNTQDSSGTYLQHLHAVDITNGAEKFGGPVTIQGSYPGNADGGSTVTFNAATQNQRPALLLANGALYIAWGSYDDDTTLGMYHGWVMAYDAATLRQTATFNTTPNGHEGSTWALGALSADQAGNIYVGAANGDPGNGIADSDTGNGNYAEAYLKLSGLSLGVLDFFMPTDWSDLTTQDQDANGGGAIALPDQPGSHPHLLVWGSKSGKIYLADRDNMGMLFSGDSHLVQSFQAWDANGCGGDDGSCVRTLPAYWNSNVYFIAQNNGLRAYSLNNGQLSTTPTSQDTSTLYTLRGATPSVSANGTSNGIVWAVKVDPDPAGNAERPSSLYAYDAANAARILYTSNDNANRDGLPIAQNFTVPMIANGKVYVATRDSLAVYGLLAYNTAQPPTAALSVTPSSGAAPLQVSASTSASSDPNPGGSIVSSWIDFGDGTVVNAITASHTYNNPGTYTVNATVYDSAGRSSRANMSVHVVSDQPPIAKLSVSPNSGNVPLSVSASTAGSSDPDGTISSSRIDFGDGTVANGASAQHTYKSSGTYTATGTVTDNAGLSSTATQTVIVGPLADNSAFVTEQYQDILDRQPDSDGMNYYSNQLNNGALTRSQLIASFMSSPEFGSHGLFAAQVYIGILARDADYGGFRWALGVLDNGGSQEQLVNIFLQSQEFQSNFGSNLDNGQFVSRMFENILLRHPDQAEFDSYVAQLNSGTMTRTQVALSLLSSSEFQKLTASQNRVRVSLLYFDLLRRQPDAGGFSYYLGQLNSGTPLNSIIDTFLDSGEYGARFH